MSKVYALAAVTLASALAACTAQQQQSASTTANDTYLVTAVGTKIASIDVDALTRVHVSSNHGVITLTGQARSVQEKLRYDEAVKSVSGVTAVRDELSVNPRAQGLRDQAADAALAARISAAIAAQAGVNAFRVRASVHEGDVTLRGTVPAQPVHQTILQTVRAVSGVKNVVDRITVGPQ